MLLFHMPRPRFVTSMFVNVTCLSRPSHQCGLLERFPEEAGAKDPADRIIPFLPGTFSSECETILRTWDIIMQARSYWDAVKSGLWLRGERTS